MKATGGTLFKRHISALEPPCRYIISPPFTSSTVSVAVANGNTSTLRFDLSDLDAGRAYVVRMTALGRTAGSRDLVGEVALDAGATPALPGFADIGGGQFVWVEGSSAPSPNERSVVVSFPREPTASSLEVTVSKPDLAFIGKPTAFVPMWGDTTGTVRLSMNIRNSSSTPSVDDESEIVVRCYVGSARTSAVGFHSFSSLRELGTSLIGAEASEMVAIGSVCQGVALSSGTSEATATSTAARSPGVRKTAPSSASSSLPAPGPRAYRSPSAMRSSV